MKTRFHKATALFLVLAMCFTMAASAAPPLNTNPVYQVLPDGTIYTRVYSGYTTEFIDLDGLVNATQIAAVVASKFSFELTVALSVAYVVMDNRREDAIDYEAVEIECYKYIETRQKPGDTSPVYTTLYYMTYHFPNGRSTSQTLSYEAMSPYSLP